MGGDRVRLGHGIGLPERRNGDGPSRISEWARRALGWASVGSGRWFRINICEVTGYGAQQQVPAELKVNQLGHVRRVTLFVLLLLVTAAPG